MLCEFEDFFYCVSFISSTGKAVVDRCVRGSEEYSMGALVLSLLLIKKAVVIML